MTNQQGAPEALRPITRYEVVDCIDSKHVPAVIPNKDGPWVLYEDHLAALVEAQQPAPSVAAHKACKPDMLVNGGALKLALNVLRRAGKHEVADELEATAQPSPSPTLKADSQPAPVLDRARIREIFMAHGFTVKEGQTDLKQYVYDAADALLRADRAQAADSVLEDAARLEALHAAVTAIYLDDSSDFKSALGAVVRHLDPKLAGDLLAWPKRAFDISQARLDAARKQGANHD